LIHTDSVPNCCGQQIVPGFTINAVCSLEDLEAEILDPKMDDASEMEAVCVGGTTDVESEFIPWNSINNVFNPQVGFQKKIWVCASERSDLQLKHSIEHLRTIVATNNNRYSNDHNVINKVFDNDEKGTVWVIFFSSKDT